MPPRKTLASSPGDYKTVIRLPADLADQIKATAAEQSASVNSVIVKAVR